MKFTFAALIPNYNDAADIANALRGVLAQTVPFDEIVIIDDGSTDDSVKIIESLIRGLPQARLYCNEEEYRRCGNAQSGIYPRHQRFRPHDVGQ